MKRILFCGYRDWSIEIYNGLSICGNTQMKIVKNTEQLMEVLESYDPDCIFFIGWSSILDKSIVDKYYCICLHPSPLPKYRGGSPIQHQIIRGEKESAVTLFKMDEKIDQGPVVFQKSFSLDGDLREVFNRITSIGRVAVQSIIDKIVNNLPLQEANQDHSQSSYYRRRKPHMSEIKPEDFTNLTAKELYDKIRALQDPYPNAFVRCKDGNKLYIYGAKIND